MKKRINLADKETWTAEKIYRKKSLKSIYIYIYIYISKMSYDNFRNGFWNPSRVDSDNQQGHSFYLKKVAIYF